MCSIFSPYFYIVLINTLSPLTTNGLYCMQYLRLYSSICIHRKQGSQRFPSRIKLWVIHVGTLASYLYASQAKLTITNSVLTWHPNGKLELFKTELVIAIVFHNTAKLVVRGDYGIFNEDRASKRVWLEKELPSYWSWITEPLLVEQAPPFLMIWRYLNLAIWNEVCSLLSVTLRPHHVNDFGIHCPKFVSMNIDNKSLLQERLILCVVSG